MKNTNRADHPQGGPASPPVWTIARCRKVYRNLKTAYVESKFALRLDYVPKHTFKDIAWEPLCKLVDLRWDQTHISDVMKEKYGAEQEKTHRAQTWTRLQARVKMSSPPGEWPVHGNTKSGAVKRKFEDYVNASSKKLKVPENDLLSPRK